MQPTHMDLPRTLKKSSLFLASSPGRRKTVCGRTNPARAVDAHAKQHSLSHHKTFYILKKASNIKTFQAKTKCNIGATDLEGNG